MTSNNKKSSLKREECGAFLRRCASERRRLSYLDSLIPLLEKRLRELRTDSPYEVRVTANWSGMPPRPGYGDPTAAAALRAIRSDFQAEVRQTGQKFHSLALEREQLLGRQARASCYLNALTADERYLIEARVIRNTPWTRVEQEYEARFGLRYHRDTLRRRLDSAVRTLNEVTSA